VTTGTNGLLTDPYNLGNVTSSQEERIEWGASPNSIVVTVPFIVSLLADSIEVHDMNTLVILQRTKFPNSSLPISMSLSEYVAVSTGNSIIRIPCVYVLNSDAIGVFSMVPLSTQVCKIVHK
jgi:hypothetical protein